MARRLGPFLSSLPFSCVQDTNQEQKKDPLPTHLFGPHPNSPFRRGELSASRLLPSVSVPDGCRARSPAPLSSVYEGVAVGSSYFLFVWRELDRLGEIRHDDEASPNKPFFSVSSVFFSSCIPFGVSDIRHNGL